MDSKSWSLIIFFIIWIILILIFGLLALNYQFKNKDYRNLKNKMSEEFIKLKDDYQLNNVLIEFELNDDEKCYFKSNSKLYIKKDKQNRLNKKFNNFNLKKIDEEDGWDDISFKKSLNVEKKQIFGLKFRLLKPDYDGIIYITNKRILLLDKNNKSYQIPISNIVNLEIIIAHEEIEMTKAIKVITSSNENSIFINCNLIEPYFVIKKLQTQKET